MVMKVAITLAAIGLLTPAPDPPRPAVPSPRGNPDLAFVLLSKPGLPKGQDVVRAFPAFAGANQRLRDQSGRSPTRAAEPVQQFDAGPCGTGTVTAIPIPVPEGEAGAAVGFSMSALGGGWQLPQHAAHLIVTLTSPDSASRLASLSCFTSFLAAVTKASGAVGVYWGSAGATHDPAFFISAAQEQDVASRIPLWTGVSVASEADGRVSLLSLGMQQLGLPDLLLVAPRARGSDALAAFFSFLAYVAERGQPLPDGDTIGRTADERLAVKYVPSPLGGGRRVWRVELEDAVTSK